MFYSLTPDNGFDVKRAAVIIQARMSSSRLPGKVLRPIGGRPMLGLLLARLEGLDRDMSVIVATSTDESDDPIAKFCEDQETLVYRGDLDDVLGRFCAAARVTQADAVVRLTADNPMVDAAAVRTALAAFNSSTLPGGIGVSNHVRGRRDPYGYAVEVVERTALEDAHRENLSPSLREHVTQVFAERNQLQLFTIEDDDVSNLRWTVDTLDDFNSVHKMLSELGPTVGRKRAIEWCQTADDHVNHR